MRVTQDMMTRAAVVNLNRQTAQLFERQNIIATQKRLHSPSDDPIGISRVLHYRKTLDSIDQYQKNIEGAQNRIEVNDLTLELVDDLLKQVKGLGEAYGNQGNTPEDRQTAADQLKQLYDQIMAAANTKLGDNYLYSGHQTDTAPFTRDDDYNATYHGDDGRVRVLVGEDTEISMDADGRNIFHKAGSGGVSVFDIVKGMIDGFENPDVDAGRAQVQAQLDLLEDARLQVNAKRAENAPKLHQLELSRNHWTQLRHKIEQALGAIEEADVPRAIIELKNLEVSYESTLATAARLIQSGLVNFLK